MAYDAQAYRRKLGGSFSTIPPASIASWIERNFDFKIRKEGREYCIDNPFDGDSGKHFNINIDKGVCHDWRGDESWAGPLNSETGKRNCSFIKFVRLVKKCSYREALQDVLGASTDVSEFLRPDRRVTDPAAQRKIAVALPKGTELLTGSADIHAKALRKWLKTRGYTDEHIAKYELHYLGMEVYWPYYEWDTLVYYQSRSRLTKRFSFPPIEVFDKTGKLIGITDGSKSDFLYGFDDVESASYLTVTEAIFDQHTLGEQALASGGAVLTERQIGKLRALGPKNGLILAPDNDKAGIKSIIQNSNMLLRDDFGFKIFYSIPPELPYLDEDDKQCVTKDWNEILVKLGKTLTEVRAIHDARIKPLTTKNLMALRRLLRDK